MLRNAAVIERSDNYAVLLCVVLCCAVVSVVHCCLSWLLPEVIGGTCGECRCPLTWEPPAVNWKEKHGRSDFERIFFCRFASSSVGLGQSEEPPEQKARPASAGCLPWNWGAAAPYRISWRWSSWSQEAQRGWVHMFSGAGCFVHPPQPCLVSLFPWEYMQPHHLQRAGNLTLSSVVRRRYFLWISLSELKGGREECTCSGAEAVGLQQLPSPGALVCLCLDSQRKGSVVLGIRRWRPPRAGRCLTTASPEARSEKKNPWLPVSSVSMV